MNAVEMIAEIGVALHRSRQGQSYAKRHGVKSAPNLAVTTDEVADLLTQYLRERIAGKVVVDIGGGIALLGTHLAAVAAQVFVIEANPTWAVAYAEFLHSSKPANLSFCWGAAQQFTGLIKADVAIVATHTDVDGMTALARQFAPTVIEVFGELVAANPEAFDEWARNARRAS